MTEESVNLKIKKKKLIEITESKERKKKTFQNYILQFLLDSEYTQTSFSYMLNICALYSGILSTKIKLI